MQMNLIETNLAQRGSLPLPSAALVIDMRGAEDDDVIERLRTEIADLATEMKVHEINHWRYLTEFLSFRSIAPLRDDDIKSISMQQKSSPSQTPKNGAKTTFETAGKGQVGLTGQIDPTNPGSVPSPFEVELGGVISESKPLDAFQQQIGDIAQEINRIRNNRIAAVADLNREGLAGRSAKETAVRVIFLTEAGNHESLVSTAVYAAHLKDYFHKFERRRQQQMVSTTVLCLNNSAEAGPPVDLIQGLRWNNEWKHIDSLLITEQFRDDAAFIAGAMQTYLAELLLYVLLIIPPIRINSSPSTLEITSLPMIEGKEADGQPKGQWVSLPPTTYLIGMAAIEHSVRWGSRWLNYGMVIKAIEILQDRSLDEELDNQRSRNVAESWLGEWLGQVEQAIPDKIPGNIPALKAIPDATSIAKPAHEVFSANGISLTIGRRTLSDLKEYLSNLLRTYTLPANERAMMRREMQKAVNSPTLQDAIDSIPQIEQRLREWEDRDPALKKGTPLVNAQLEAQRVLSHPSFFSGVRGSVPRARIQLKELGNTISDFKNAHEQNALDLTDRKKQLEKRGNDMIDDLSKHVEQVPLLATKIRLRQPMAWATFLLAFALAGLAMLFGLAWLRHAIFLTHPDWLPVIDTVLLVNDSPIAIGFWIIIGLLIIVVVFFLANKLTAPSRTNLEVEFSFELALLVTAIAGLILNFSIDRFVDDPGSLELLTWLSSFRSVSIILFIIFVVILCIEVSWGIFWFRHLLDERNRIVQQLRRQHSSDVEAVTHFIAETIALQILLRTELTDGKGGPGNYYTRVDALYKQLSNIEHEADYQYKLAANRIRLGLSEIHPGTSTSPTGRWLNLKIREEFLDEKSLADGYKRLTERMSKDSEDLREFAELLLRIMGEETPTQIEQQFRDKTSNSREQRQARLFMATLVAMVLRFSIAPDSLSSITPLIERYENIDNQYIHEQLALSALIETLNKKVSEATIQPIMASSQSGGSWAMGNSPDGTRANTLMATDAVATWAQMLWDTQDAKLKKTLTNSGVLAKLMGDNEHGGQAIMRLLQARTSLFGRSIQAEQNGDVYLLLSPSPQSRLFRQSLNIPSRVIIDFPDIERLLLLFIQHYVAEALFIPDPEPEVTAASPVNEVSPPGTTLFTYQGHSKTVYAVAWSPDGSRIASAGRDYTVQVWDAATGGNVLIQQTHTAPVHAVAWSPDGKHIASGSSDRTIQVWDAVTESLVYTFPAHSDSVCSVAWSPDSTRIASASWDRTVQVWDALTGTNVLIYKDHPNRVQTVAWSPDGKYIASASTDNKVRVWDATTGTTLYTYAAHKNWVESVAWSHDSKYIASASGDNGSNGHGEHTVHVWDAITGSTLYIYQGHTDEVTDVVWSPDGKRIASSSGRDEHQIHVWDAFTGNNVLIYQDHSNIVWSVAWAPEGKRIASASKDQTVQVWQVV